MFSSRVLGAAEKRFPATRARMLLDTPGVIPLSAAAASRAYQRAKLQWARFDNDGTACRSDTQLRHRRPRR